MRVIELALPWLVLFACSTLGQTTATNAPRSTESSLAVENESEKRWSFSASVYTYIAPEERDYAQPILTFDRDWLHLETRYNYEDLQTGSVWAGYNFGGGQKWIWEFTPMLGAVFGESTTGIAPGYKGSLSWRKFELYSEGEYVFDTSDGS